MNSRIVSITASALIGLASLSASAQVVTTPSGGANIGGPNATAPSGAPITHTPGTPGASDTPGALQAGKSEDSSSGPSASDIRKMKKQARKAASSSPAPSSSP